MPRRPYLVQDTDGKPLGVLLSVRERWRTHDLFLFEGRKMTSPSSLATRLLCRAPKESRASDRSRYLPRRVRLVADGARRARGSRDCLSVVVERWGEIIDVRAVTNGEADQV